MPKAILTVDDSTTVRQVASFALRNAGYDTIEATDGREAVARISGNIQLVITDLNMPNMDGIELIRRIRTGPTNRRVLIIVLTTESEPATNRQPKPPAPPDGSSNPSVPSS